MLTSGTEDEKDTFLTACQVKEKNKVENRELVAID